MKSVLTGALLFLLATLPLRAQVALDLRDADLRSFVEIVSEATGRNFVIDPQIRGTVTVFAPNDLSAGAIEDIFRNVLELNRLTVVSGDGADRIVPLGTARELAPGGTTALRGGYETRVIPVRNVPVAEIVEVLRPLLPAEAVLSTVPEAGLIILSDRRENQERIERLIVRLDEAREQPLESIRLRNASAFDVLQVVQQLEDAPAGASVTADRRSNSILVTGPLPYRERVRTIVRQLDTPQRTTATQVVQLNYADAAALGDVVLRSFADRQSEADAPITIVPEPRSNALLVTAPPDKMTDIVQAILHLDRRPRQVLVEAVIFEMSVENFSDLSFQFGKILNDAIVGGAQFSLDGRQTLTGVLSAAINGTAPQVGDGGFLAAGQRNKDGNGFAALLTAVARQTSTRLLSTPSIMTLNNQEAEIVVAQNVPFVTGSFATVGDSAVPNDPFQTIERQDVGLTLRVTPQINADNTVRMSVAQEVSNLTNLQSDAGGEITAKRSITTNVLVRSGNVIMLGGLLADDADSTGQRVPGLSRIPGIGKAFRGRNVRDTQSVLLVMLRPRVIVNDEQARQVTQEVARETRRASRLIQPANDGTYPAVPSRAFPFDGADLNQPFDAGFIDGVATERDFPPLPSRLRFQGQ